MLFDLATVLLFFLFLSCCFNNFFIIPVVKENTKTLANPAGTPITLVKEIILIPPDVADKIIKVLSIYLKAATYLLSFLLIVFLSWMSVSK